MPGYDWIENEQLAWMLEQARASEATGSGAASGLAFFHIPLPEFEMIRSNITGERGERTACPDVNSGAIPAFLETGHVKAAFCGHDHINDFCGEYFGPPRSIFSESPVKRAKKNPRVRAPSFTGAQCS